MWCRAISVFRSTSTRPAVSARRELVLQIAQNSDIHRKYFEEKDQLFFWRRRTYSLPRYVRCANFTARPSCFISHKNPSQTEVMCDWMHHTTRAIASNAMTCIQTIFFFSVREPGTALSPLAMHFECVQISVFCYISVIVDCSKAKTWKCLRFKHLTSYTLKTWWDLAITCAALGRLLDARLVRPPLQTHTKAVQLAKKGQVNNVLPSCKPNETSMLRLQIVVQSTLFPKKISPWLEKLSKPPQGASKLASFDTFVAVRMHVVTFFFLRRTCSCRLSTSFSSHLTPDQLVLSNTVLQPNRKAFRLPKRWRGSTDQDRSSVRPLHALCVHCAFRRWSFGSRTLTRLDSNSCVDNGVFFLRLLSLGMPSSTFLPVFQLALHPASTPDSSRHRSLISPPRNHVAFSFAKQVSFEHSIRSPAPIRVLARNFWRRIQRETAGAREKFWYLRWLSPIFLQL